MNLHVFGKKESSLKLYILYIFSGKPLTFGTVFTAFGVVLFGLSLSLGLLLIEIITTKYGHVRCKRIMNAYNYRIIRESSPVHEGQSVDGRRQLPKIHNPW